MNFKQPLACTTTECKNRQNMIYVKMTLYMPEQSLTSRVGILYNPTCQFTPDCKYIGQLLTKGQMLVITNGVTLILDRLFIIVIL